MSSHSSKVFSVRLSEAEQQLLASVCHEGDDFATAIKRLIFDAAGGKKPEKEVTLDVEPLMREFVFVRKYLKSMRREALQLGFFFHRARLVDDGRETVAYAWEWAGKEAAKHIERDGMA